MPEEIVLTNVESEVKVHKPRTRDLSQMDISPELKEQAKSIEQQDVNSYLKKVYEQMKQSDPNAKCPSCGGKPMKGQICPICGSGAYQNDSVVIETLTSEEQDKLYIPEKYRKERFDSSKLKASHETLSGSKSFNDYISLLNAILEKINNRVLEKSSLFISAPSGFGKETFAYSALQLATARGLSVFPYLDIMEVSRLIDAYEKGDKTDPIIKDIGFSDAELYRSEVCILKVPHMDVNFTNYKVMLKVIDRRARRGLPTIILSRYNFKYFTALDKFKETEGIVSYNNPSPKNLQVYETSNRV